MAEKIEKISYENWLPAARKWVKIVDKVQSGEKFWDGYSFRNLLVVETCGYCLQFYSWTKLQQVLQLLNLSTRGCKKCSLSKLGKQNIPICSGSELVPSHFWLFVFEMQKGQPDFKIAYKESKIIQDAILEDCPNRKQAIMDGIVFDSTV